MGEVLACTAGGARVPCRGRAAAVTMEVQLQSSPKRKEPAREEKLLKLEKSQTWKDELEDEFHWWSARVHTLLEKFEGELNQVGGKSRRTRTAEEARMADLEKRVGGNGESEHHTRLPR